MCGGAGPAERVEHDSRAGRWWSSPIEVASWDEGVGHLPHLQEPERFNRELAGLTRRVRG